MMADSTKKRSDVWKYFELEGKKAKCLLCSKALSYCGGTTNLREHLNAKHKCQYQTGESSQANREAPLQSFFKPKSCPTGRASEITDKVVDMITMDLRPVAVVEGAGFQRMMAALEPGYKCPSRKHISTIIQRKHDLCIERLKVHLESSTACSLTTDIWSSCATEAFVTLTVHYLSDEWEMNSFVLETSGFPERHTAINIADKLNHIADKYTITGKVAAVVHDNAANMVAALNLLHEKHGWESLRCVAHTLQLCLIPGLAITSINRMVVAARKLVGHFKHSVVATEELKKREVQMDLTEMKLLQDCPTR